MLIVTGSLLHGLDRRKNKDERVQLALVRGPVITEEEMLQYMCLETYGKKKVKLSL
jgi:hypothetical protein